MKHEGGHHYQENLKLSYKDWPELVINKNLPWEWVNIGDAGNEHWIRTNHGILPVGVMVVGGSLACRCVPKSGFGIDRRAVHLVV
jgi:hypothetical protein